MRVELSNFPFTNKIAVKIQGRGRSPVKIRFRTSISAWRRAKRSSKTASANAMKKITPKNTSIRSKSSGGKTRLPEGKQNGPAKKNKGAVDKLAAETHPATDAPQPPGADRAPS